VRSVTAYDALDVALEFTNGGATDTPILENIKLVAWDLDCVPNTPEISSYYGGTGNWESCAKHLAMLQPNAVTDLHTVTGLSSDQLLPYFNLHDEKWNGTAFDEGFQGMIIAIGWIGNWEADFLWKGSGPVNLRAGMPKTHLLLHPGETIRTPRIVLMNWVGTEADSQNIWRRFVRDFYSPKPLCGHIPKGQSAKPSAQ
jgi:alpha-galactosidase